jgi:hypothetical protein
LERAAVRTLVVGVDEVRVFGRPVVRVGHVARAIADAVLVVGIRLVIRRARATAAGELIRAVVRSPNGSTTLGV